MFFSSSVLNMKINCYLFFWLAKNCSFFIVVVMLAAIVTVAPAFPFDLTFKFKNGKEQLQNFIPETGDGRSVKKGLCHFKQYYLLLLKICYK